MHRGKVTRIPDGDTIKVKDGPWIRLANVNAPEKGHPGFEESREALKNLVSQKEVTYTPVAEDAYGRTVANVKVGNKSVNQTMKKKGYK